MKEERKRDVREETDRRDDFLQGRSVWSGGIHLNVSAQKAEAGGSPRVQDCYDLYTKFLASQELVRSFLKKEKQQLERWLKD